MKRSRAFGGEKCGLLLILFFTLTLPVCVMAQMEAKWTPNPEDDGPLPLSQAQRQQLLQLEQTIMSSPDPQATLQQVAESNGMQPEELVNMLQRNRSDLGGAAAGGRRQISAWPQKISKLMVSAGLIAAQVFQRNPKLVSLFATTLLLLFYIMFTAPRTGFVISSSPSLLSKGPTAVWSPPQKYIAGYMDSPQFERKSFSSKAAEWGDLPRFLKEDGVEWHKMNRKSPLAQAVAAQRTIDVLDFTSDEEDDENEEEGETARDRRRELQELVYDAAATVLSSRRLTEFVENHSVRIQTSTEGRRRSATLIARKMGDWDRYGLQPLRVSTQNDGEAESTLTYATLKGGHFDGQLQIILSQRRNDAVSIQVRISVPKKGRKLNKKVAMTIASALAQSIEKSTRTQTKQTLTRRSQGKRYRGKVHSRASERRQLRYENEKKQEEMAKDRRRKWQRQNPDAGRYRPSGERMRSPNNC